MEQIQGEFREDMNALARELDVRFNGAPLPGLPPGRAIGGKVGFALLTFYTGKVEGGRVNYISNANREDMLAAMREFIARAEGQPMTGGQA